MAYQHSFDDFSPKEFEHLCRDLIQKKICEENNQFIILNSFPEGPDSGIDAVSENTKHKIVLQCKRYGNFISLYSNLKFSELPKIIALKPTRYIIATSYDLSVKQVDKIYELLKPHLQQKSDIIGRAMLNNLLGVYPEIEFRYPRLFLSNTTTLRYLLNANVYNQSNEKLRTYNYTSRFYVSDGCFQQAMKILSERRYVTISGEPGVGKSTLAGMISLYYIGQGYDFFFLRRSVSEVEGRIWDEQKKQIFLFDDFLGSTAFHDFDRNEDRQLLDFIKKVSASSNKLLLITTREYVFRQAEVKYPELKNLQLTKCIIRQKEFTDTFKANILYNYLYYSPIELEDIRHLLYCKKYNEIIYHRNFTPRLIADYIENYYEKDTSFFYGLKRYMDDPYIYWESIFLKLSINAQMFLLILAITEEPAIDELLFLTFVRLNDCRKLFDRGYERDSFEQAIAELSESFISISHNPKVDKKKGDISTKDLSLIFNSFQASRFIEFQNPSVKDFALNYLRKREDLMVYLLKSATLFTQLIFVFTTLEDDKDIEDYDGDASFSYSVGKILLSPVLQILVADKIIKEFDSLPIAKVRKIDWQGGDISFHPDEIRFNNRMEKLWHLCRYFPLNEYEKMREFVINKYSQLLYEDKEYKAKTSKMEDQKCYPLALEERIIQTDLIKKLHPYMKFDPVQVVSDYYENIRFSKEFISLNYLEEIFPEAYRQVVGVNIKRIRLEIKDMIYDDIDYYKWEGTHEAEEAIAELVDEDVQQLKEIYKFKMSKKLMRDINDMAGEEIFRMDSTEKIEDSLYNDQEKFSSEELSPEANEETQNYQNYELAMASLDPQWDHWEEEEAFQYIQSKTNDIAISEALIKRITESSNFQVFLDNAKSVDLLLNYLQVYDNEPENAYSFYEGILRVNRLDGEIERLQKIAYNLYTNSLFTFREFSLMDASDKGKKDDNTITNIYLCNAILLQEDIWCTFVTREFHIFLAGRHILSWPQKEKTEIYKSFKQVYDMVEYSNPDTLWQFLFEADKQLFFESFVIPVLEQELASNYSKNIDEMTIIFLTNSALKYEFEYSKEDGCFYFSSGSSEGHVLLEDIFSACGWEVMDPFFEIENCFNIDKVKDASVNNYLKKYCPVKDGRYSIDISLELANKEFRDLLGPAGVTNIVIHYVEALQSILADIRE
jgi:hypothetical protein